MQTKAILPQVIDWNRHPGEKIAGERGYYIVRSFSENGNNFKVVDYSPNYVSDAWCLRGHFVYVIEGIVTVEHSDNSSYELEPNSSYIVGNDTMPHRISSESGAKVLIVD
jgi:hypothetical protein